MTKQYRLGSSPLVFAPGLIAWAINGASFKRDRKKLINIVQQTWSIPADAATALVTKTVAYAVEIDTVVFNHGEKQS